ncbi:MAG: hypothetical protein Ct9H300mP5_5280 [Candidatus Pelagibacterales bacterium]|nr:MAG: hypothetical protein Ct9H300mP5_5280 [Pelagibacterales bacterium]
MLKFNTNRVAQFKIKGPDEIFREQLEKSKSVSVLGRGFFLMGLR